MRQSGNTEHHRSKDITITGILQKQYEEDFTIVQLEKWVTSSS